MPPIYPYRFNKFPLIFSKISKLLSVGSQNKNDCLVILVCVDGLWVSRGFLKSLNVRIAFLRVEATVGISAHITSGEDGDRDEYCP